MTFVDVLVTGLDQETVELLSFVGDWNGHTLILEMTNQKLLVNWLSAGMHGRSKTPAAPAATREGHRCLHIGAASLFYSRRDTC